MNKEMIEDCIQTLERLKKTVINLKGEISPGDELNYQRVIKEISHGDWIAIKSRPMTEDEKAYYHDELEYVDYGEIFDCKLPDDGQEVLITTKVGAVFVDTFFNDYDGCGFECFDVEDVAAWMQLPEPYKEGGTK